LVKYLSLFIYLRSITDTIKFGSLNLLVAIYIKSGLNSFVSFICEVYDQKIAFFTDLNFLLLDNSIKAFEIVRFSAFSKSAFVQEKNSLSFRL